MEIGRLKGTTRVAGKGQGYLGLPIRDTVVHDTVTGPGTPMMETAWIPSIEELQALVKGASIIVQIAGREPPPMMVKVGDTPE